MKAIILVLLTGIALPVFSQEYRYVAVDTAHLKEYPDNRSRTYIYLHEPTKIEVHPITDKRYQATPEIIENWYIVRFFINDGTRFGGRTYKGYMEKNKLSPTVVQKAGLDTSVTFSYTIPGDTIRHDLRFFKSSKGGCYYINSAGRKEHVNFCR